MSGEYLGDFKGSETITIVFDSFNSAGASATLTGLAVANIEIYKNGSVTQRSSDAGVALIDTDGIDIDSATGIHGFTIDLSDNTDAGFYAPQNEYYVVVTGLTIDSQSVSFIAARFSIQNRFNKDVQAVGGALNYEATTDNTGGAIKSITFVGSQTGTYTNTEANDGSYHQITHSTNNIDIVYQFNVGRNKTAASFEFIGYLDGANDSINVQAYDFVGADWETRTVINGQNGSENNTFLIGLLSKHTGTGGEAGDVLIRFVCSAQTSPILYVDLLLVQGVNLGQSVGYSNGAIWIDTNTSNTNTDVFIDGVADNPVSTIAAANTLNTTLGLDKFDIHANSTITLAATQTNHLFMGNNWTLALGGQNVGGSRFSGASNGVSGTCSGTNPFFYECSIGNVTLPPCAIQTSGFAGTITTGSAGDFFFVDCYSQVAGTSTPTLDAGAAIGGSNYNFRRYSGGIEIQNLQAGDSVSLEGNGQLIINANCTGGTITIRGNFKFTDNASGAVNLVVSTPIAEQVHQGTAQAGTANTITLAASASATDGAYDPSKILIVTGSGAGESRTIIDYNGTTKVAVVNKDWRTTPTSNSSYIIYSASSELHVNEGLAQAGAASTITLNTSASSTDDIYIGQTIFIVAGTGQDQSRIVTDYNGTTKVATVHRAWDIQPSSASSYIMMPLPAAGDSIVSASASATAAAVWDEAFSGHTTNGTYGKLVKNLGEGVVSADSTVNDASATTTSFITNLTESADDFFNDKVLVFIDGALKGQSSPIQYYNGTTKSVTFDAIDAFTSAPANGSAFIILANHIHPISQIKQQVRAEMDANSTQLTAIVDDTNEIQTDLADGGRIDLILDELTTQGDTNETKIDTIDANVDAILVDTGTTIPAQIAALENVSINQLLYTPITESYAAAGAVPTVAQMLYLIQQRLGDFAINGTTISVKKIDGVTAAANYTIDDAINPTSTSRSS